MASFCITSSLEAHRLCIQNLVEFAPRARIYIFFTPPPCGQNIKTLYSYKRKLEDIWAKMKFHNNPFRRIYVNREQLFAEPTQTYRQTGRQEFCWGCFRSYFAWNVCNQNLAWFGPMYRQNLNFIYILLYRCFTSNLTHTTWQKNKKRKLVNY